ncbi:LysR family transcriptional regulator [Yoonia sp. BS5-3]|uniref:LysR family transcriptional regulator n=1 Tax=Yoonia phaeophyticola TaxID=3137369 RepID=A0ABZ3IE10_9RHOB
MYNIAQLRSMAAAIEAGSLSAAARNLGLTQPAVSQHLQQLEQSMGRQLIVRIPRGIRPTRAGEIAYAHTKDVLRRFDDMDKALDALDGTISGTLRFTTNIIFSQTVAAQFFSEMRRRAPKLKVEIIPSDDLLDIEAEEIDLALRGGTGGNGSGVIRRIGTIKGVLVAAPQYLDRVGRPQTPADLINLDYVQYLEDPTEDSLPLFDADGVEIVAPIKLAFAARSPNLLLQAVQDGLGFVKAPYFYVREQINTGVLNRVLPAYLCEGKPLYLVQTPDQAQSLRNQLARDVLFSILDQTDGLSLTTSARKELEQTNPANSTETR